MCSLKSWPVSPLFAGLRNLGEMLEAKWTLPQRLDTILPDDVADSDLLMSICRRLDSPDTVLRYASAEDADTGPGGLGRVSADPGDGRSGQRIRKRTTCLAGRD